MAPTLKPDIRIEPYCVFCNRYTENVSQYMYFFSQTLSGGYDRALINFPTHRRCFLLRRIGQYFVFIAGGTGIFFLFGWFLSLIFFKGRPVLELPLGILITSGIIGLVGGAYMGLRIHGSMESKIHDYYVLKENIPEADKSWRRRSPKY